MAFFFLWIWKLAFSIWAFFLCFFEIGVFFLAFFWAFFSVPFFKAFFRCFCFWIQILKIGGFIFWRFFGRFFWAFFRVKFENWRFFYGVFWAFLFWAFFFIFRRFFWAFFLGVFWAFFSKNKKNAFLTTIAPPFRWLFIVLTKHCPRRFHNTLNYLHFPPRWLGYFFLVNRVEHQKFNQTTAELPFGWVFSVQLGLRKIQALINTNCIT